MPYLLSTFNMESNTSISLRHKHHFPGGQRDTRQIFNFSSIEPSKVLRPFDTHFYLPSICVSSPSVADSWQRLVLLLLINFDDQAGS